MTVNAQKAPYPTALADLLTDFAYKDGWRFVLGPLDRGQGSTGLTLDIFVATTNSYRKEPGHPRQFLTVSHRFPVPPAAYVASSWRRWLLDRIIDVETHEAMEFFTVGGKKPYAPNHGPGHDPYTIRELATAEERATMWHGGEAG